MEPTLLFQDGQVRIATRWDDTGLKFMPSHTPPLDTLLPRELMLYSLGLCAAKTAKALLDKMRVEFSAMEVCVTGTLDDLEPKSYTAYRDMHIEFRITADAETLPRVEHAIEITHDKYCGLTLMFQKIAPVTNTLVFNP